MVSTIFEKFVTASPVTVMVRAIMERIFSPEKLDALFDGNHLGATEHRLAVLRQNGSGALPGQSLAVLDPDWMLVRDLFPCEDGHTRERSLFPSVLERVIPGQ